MILNIFSRIFDYVMILLIVLNLSLRKYRDGQNKRFSTILIALIFLGVYFLLIFVDWLKLPSWCEYISLGIGVILLVVFRKRLWPWRMKCKECGKKMNWDAILGRDENLCDECWEKKYPEKKKEREEKEKLSPQALSLDKIDERCRNAEKVEDVPWGSWEPSERCVLTYVMDGDNVLLILKKRGLGDGYYNAPGGHIELEETSTEAAIRETKEETGLTVSDLKERGTLRFQFKDGMRMVCYVFTTSVWEGGLKECDEAKPFWADKNNLDYDMMWKDDKLWLPLLLDGKEFEGWFVFDDREMLDAKVECVSEE